MLTPEDFLHELRRRGAKRIRCVRFKDNRSTVWSLTQRGTTLNVHSAFRRATPEILRAFAVLASEGGVRSARSREASDTVAAWPPLQRAIERARRQHQEQIAADQNVAGRTRCCGTPEQQAYLKALYRYFNETRFNGRLPRTIPVRLNNRMQSALGHMLPGEREDGSRYVVEIALNVDLMLSGNGAERVDTLLHEMAHAADYLESGNRGHGPSWRAWAKRVGCRAMTLYDRPVRFRRRRSDAVTRVPPLPPALRRSA